jgi:hypothetical protein
VKRLGVLSLALALLATCDDHPVTYSYFIVTARLDANTISPQLLTHIGSCGVYARTPEREDASDLGCVLRKVQYELGKFEYTTTLTSGSVNFVVVANDLNQRLVARGETGPIAIKRGDTAPPVDVLVTLVPGGDPDLVDAGAESADASPPTD